MDEDNVLGAHAHCSGHSEQLIVKVVQESASGQVESDSELKVNTPPLGALNAVTKCKHNLSPHSPAWFGTGFVRGFENKFRGYLVRAYKRCVLV